jgi:stage V sporulation protein G
VQLVELRKNYDESAGEYSTAWNLVNRENHPKGVRQGVNYRVKITDVRLRKVTTEGRMKAIASITFDSEFVVHDIRIIDGNNGMFVAMPSKKTPDGEFRDIAHPISSTTRQKIQDAVLQAYYRVGDAVEEEAEYAVEEPTV